MNAQRWLVGINASGEDIPPYSVVSLAEDIAVPNHLTVRTDGQVAFRVFQPHDHDEYMQNPALLAVCGPHGIRKGKDGPITQDWPTQARYETASTVFNPQSQDWVNLSAAGGWDTRLAVVAGQWGLAPNSAGAFSMLGYAATAKGKAWTPGTADGLATCMVTAHRPELVRANAMFGFTTVEAATPTTWIGMRADGDAIFQDDTTAAPGIPYYANTAGSVSWVQPSSHTDVILYGGTGVGGSQTPATEYRFCFRYPGTYLVHLQGTFAAGPRGTPATAANTADAAGAVIPYQSRSQDGIHLFPQTDAIALPFQMAWDFATDQEDLYGSPVESRTLHLGYEFPASCAGYLSARAGDMLILRASCTTQIYVTACMALFHRIGPYQFSRDFLLESV